MLLICASHSPLQLTNIEPTSLENQKRYFSSLSDCARALTSYGPELVVVFAPDHFNGLFYDLMPSFCIGVEAHSTEDWGLPAVKLAIPKDCAEACVRHVLEKGVDVAISYRLQVDHGTTIPLLRLGGVQGPYSILPIVINCAADPRPSFRRVRALGSAVGGFLRSLKMHIAIVASGGLSHDPPTPRLGQCSDAIAQRLIDRHTPTKAELEQRQSRVMAACRALVRGEGPMLPPNEQWDREFIRNLLALKLEVFDEWTDQFLDKEAGFGGHEVRCWVAAAAAMSEMGSFSAEERFYAIIPEWATGMAVIMGQH